jgi:hypothetical protein
MLAILSPILGILGGLLPSIVRIFERKQELQHEIALTQIKLDAAKSQAEIQLVIEGAKADAAEASAVRSFDNNVDGGKLINALRASVRPVITYTFFILFIAVKTAAAYVMIKNGTSIPDMLKAIWDPETMALFSTIMAFWFGSRTLEKSGTRIAQNYNFIKKP